MTDEDSNNSKFTMTITAKTEAWLSDTYPDALDIQDAIRMAISDARIIREHRDVTVMNGNSDD